MARFPDLRPQCELDLETSAYGRSARFAPGWWILPMAAIAAFGAGLAACSLFAAVLP
jgi:hypothetical protein